MGVDWENVVGSGVTREIFAEELVKYFNRRGLLDELVEQVMQDRPRLFDDESIIEANNFDGDSYVGTTSSISGGSFFNFSLIFMGGWYLLKNPWWKPPALSGS